MIRTALVTLTGTLEVEIDDEDMDEVGPDQAARDEATWDCHCDVVEFHDIEWL